MRVAYGLLASVQAKVAAVQAKYTIAMLSGFLLLRYVPHVCQLQTKLHGVRGALHFHAAVLQMHVEPDADCGQAARQDLRLSAVMTAVFSEGSLPLLGVTVPFASWALGLREPR